MVKRNSLYIMLITLICVSGLINGYNISIIASVLPRIKAQYMASHEIVSLLAGLVFAGIMFAKFLMAVLNDYYGRRKTLMIASTIFASGTFSMLLADSMTYILIGRVLQGIGGGLLMATTSLYVAEIAKSKTRGSLMSMFQLSFTFGLLFANIVGMVFYNMNWRISFALLFLATMCFMYLAYALPCSPSWLYRRGDLSGARKSLQILHNEEEITQVMSFWQSSQILAQSGNILQLKYMRPLLLVIVIACLNQLTGINAILQVSTVLFEQNPELNQHAALFSSIGITLVNVVFTMIGMKVVDKLPRNMLLGYCGIFICVVHLFLAANFYFKLDSPFVLVGGLMFFIAAYAIGPGILIWLVFAEYLPMPVRSKGIAIAGFISSLAAFLISSLFLYLGNIYGMAMVFFVCAICSLIYGIIPIVYLPDANGNNIDNFDKLFHADGTKE